MQHAQTGSWDDLEFDDLFVRSLPADPDRSATRRQVRHAMFSFVDPTPVRDPIVVAHAPEVAKELGLTAEMMQSKTAAEVFGGNRKLEGMKPYAAVYGGHQFGNWAGQLGDGRAITLGERLSPRGQRLELQLKGAGPTPYSRTADGRAVMRSSVREFLMSEAMHHLGVPTTRALSLVGTGDDVVRDMFYDGRPKAEPGAIVCRVAPSFLRFGNFEIFAANKDMDNLRRLVDYTITNHFPELGDPGRDTYIAWLADVARRTAVMIMHWMRVGFVHGVMNTDNMSVLGLTIDYGPYGWLDNFDPNWTPNTTDAHGRRYRFGYQPRMAQWNLTRLAEAVFPLVGDEDAVQSALSEYARAFDQEQQRGYLAKLGLARFNGNDDLSLVQDVLELLSATEIDMTIFFRRLADIDLGDGVDAETLLVPLLDAYYGSPDPDARQNAIDWLERYRRRTADENMAPDKRRALMNGTNPKYVLRNYMAQMAIDELDKGDPSLLHTLQALLRKPYDEQPQHESFFSRRPDWARDRPGCSTLSCSS